MNKSRARSEIFCGALEFGSSQGPRHYNVSETIQFATKKKS